MKKRKFGLPVSEKHVSTQSQIQNPGRRYRVGIESQAKARAADAPKREPTVNTDALKKTTCKFLLRARSKSL